MICKRYFALKDSLGFPIPGTVRGYDKDPCKCELVELVVSPPVIEGEDQYRRYHPNGLHYYYLVDGKCSIVPNSLIVTNQRPKGRYVEFLAYNEFFFTVRTQSFTRNNCGANFTGSSVSFSKTYTSTTDQATVDALAAADATFTTQGQAKANAEGTCTPV